MSSKAKLLVEYMARELVEHPEQVSVTETGGTGSTLALALRVAPDDVGRVIGRNGHVANSMRALLRVLAAREGQRIQLEIQ